jgi:hypothetical protein
MLLECLCLSSHNVQESYLYTLQKCRTITLKTSAVVTLPSFQEKGSDTGFMTDLLHKYTNTVKIRTELSKCLIKHYAMNTYGEEQLHTFLTSAQDRGEWSASCPATLTLWKQPMVSLHNGWVGPRNSLNAAVRRKISVPVRNQILISQSPRP